MKAIIGGTDMVADVIDRARHGDKVISANSVHGDTVIASVEVILKGMNRILEKVKSQ